ncbi:Uncharacterized protein HZ326_28524, partial [Fusarium oxysporum f. sp. albedinis]
LAFQATPRPSRKWLNRRHSTSLEPSFHCSAPLWLPGPSMPGSSGKASSAWQGFFVPSCINCTHIPRKALWFGALHTSAERRSLAGEDCSFFRRISLWIAYEFEQSFWTWPRACNSGQVLQLYGRLRTVTSWTKASIAAFGLSTFRRTCSSLS